MTDKHTSVNSMIERLAYERWQRTSSATSDPYSESLADWLEAETDSRDVAFGRAENATLALYCGRYYRPDATGGAGSIRVVCAFRVEPSPNRVYIKTSNPSSLVYGTSSASTEGVPTAEGAQSASVTSDAGPKQRLTRRQLLERRMPPRSVLEAIINRGKEAHDPWLDDKYD